MWPKLAYNLPSACLSLPSMKESPKFYLISFLFSQSLTCTYYTLSYASIGWLFGCNCVSFSYVIVFEDLGGVFILFIYLLRRSLYVVLNLLELTV